MHVRRVWSVAATVVAFALVAILAVPALAAFSTPVPHAGVFDPSAREWLYEKAIDDVVPVASLTKLTTALTVMRLRVDLDAPVAITEDDWVGAGRTRLRVDDAVPVRTLLKLALVCSDNCAARALVHAAGLTTEAFAFSMEETAARLGCKKSSYVEPTGLDERNVSTAREVVTLFNAAMQDPLLREFLGTSEFELSTPRGPRTIVHSARLLRARDDVEAAKTGYIDESGYCLVQQVADPHGDFVTVVLGGHSQSARSAESTRLINLARELRGRRM
jgi:D-alanyl-D-alanine endopeptidase (penicillin-binding protein 7)